MIFYYPVIIYSIEYMKPMTILLKDLKIRNFYMTFKNIYKFKIKSKYVIY